MAVILSKTAYAAHAGVKPAAVSNWIARQKLTAPALRADGTIDRDRADRQLGRTVNPMLSAAARALQPPQPAEGGSGAAWSPRDQAGTQLLRARALSASVDAERKRRELNSERGKYTLTAQVEADFARVLTGFLTDVEQSCRAGRAAFTSFASAFLHFLLRLLLLSTRPRRHGLLVHFLSPLCAALGRVAGTGWRRFWSLSRRGQRSSSPATF